MDMFNMMKGCSIKELIDAHNCSKNELYTRLNELEKKIQPVPLRSVMERISGDIEDVISLANVKELVMLHQPNLTYAVVWGEDYRVIENCRALRDLIRENSELLKFAVQMNWG